MIPLWREWMLMERLRCNWFELQAMPQSRLDVFEAFMRGEAGARQAKA